MSATHPFKDNSVCIDKEGTPYVQLSARTAARNANKAISAYQVTGGFAFLDGTEPSPKPKKESRKKPLASPSSTTESLFEPECSDSELDKKSEPRCKKTRPTPVAAPAAGGSGGGSSSGSSNAQIPDDLPALLPLSAALPPLPARRPLPPLPVLASAFQAGLDTAAAAQKAAGRAAFFGRFLRYANGLRGMKLRKIHKYVAIDILFIRC